MVSGQTLEIGHFTNVSVAKMGTLCMEGVVQWQSVSTQTEGGMDKTSMYRAVQSLPLWTTALFPASLVVMCGSGMSLVDGSQYLSAA